MTVFDYLVLFVLAASVVVSTLRGLIAEVLSLLAWVVAFVVANAFGAQLAALLPLTIPGDAVRLMVAFVALFVGTRILMGLVAKVIDALIKAGGLTLVDRGLGGLFGLGRGVVLVLAAVIVCGMTALPRQPFWKNALLSPIVETAARTVKPYLPEALARHVQF